jgi:hypothetical protein
MEPSPFLVERHKQIVDLAVPTNTTAQSYVFGAAVTLNAAYAGVTSLFEVPAKASYVSYSIRKSGENRVQESNRGLTRAMWNPDEFSSGTVPGDSLITFVRVAPRDWAGVLGSYSAILVVPPPDFFSSGRKNLVLNGTAPNVAAGVNNIPPQNAMRISLPHFADEVVLYNTGGSTLYVSFGEGLQEAPVAAGTHVQFKEAGVNEMFLRGNTAFTALCSVVNGIQA